MIVTVSEQKTEFMRRMHPEPRPGEETLTNSYDSEIYADRRKRTRAFDGSKTGFVYTGPPLQNRRGARFPEALGRNIKQSDTTAVAGVQKCTDRWV